MYLSSSEANIASSDVRKAPYFKVRVINCALWRTSVSSLGPSTSSVFFDQIHRHLHHFHPKTLLRSRQNSHHHSFASFHESVALLLPKSAEMVVQRRWPLAEVMSVEFVQVVQVVQVGLQACLGGTFRILIHPPSERYSELFPVASERPSSISP